MIEEITEVRKQYVLLFWLNLCQMFRFFNLSSRSTFSGYTEVQFIMRITHVLNRLNFLDGGPREVSLTYAKPFGTGGMMSLW